eukprot:TRINITY_DN2268_c0_g1_i2.p1 TRINITY_DN2268_c0_g1~~TRINITY_DN2268_c0_g1_i2.p1  ORF type:complete len:386 (-),score=34.52 TRINITY_DN2268_c0_g1_i2:88-1245(-)
MYMGNPSKFYMWDPFYFAGINASLDLITPKHALFLGKEDNPLFNSLWSPNQGDDIVQFTVVCAKTLLAIGVTDDHMLLHGFKTVQPLHFAYQPDGCYIFHIEKEKTRLLKYCIDPENNQVILKFTRFDATQRDLFLWNLTLDDGLFAIKNEAKKSYLKVQYNEKSKNYDVVVDTVEDRIIGEHHNFYLVNEPRFFTSNSVHIGLSRNFTGNDKNLFNPSYEGDDHSNVFNFPPELTGKILSFLTPTDRRNIRSVCTPFRDSIPKPCFFLYGYKYLDYIPSIALLHRFPPLQNYISHIEAKIKWVAEPQSRICLSIMRERKLIVMYNLFEFPEIERSFEEVEHSVMVPPQITSLARPGDIISLNYHVAKRGYISVSLVFSCEFSRV